jgi:hypothetical protein
MEKLKPFLERPIWVRVGLWGLTTRGAAMAFFWLSVVLAFAPLLLLIWVEPVIVAIVMLFSVPGMLAAALWYWLAIRWVDRHDGWANHSRRLKSA